MNTEQIIKGLEAVPECTCHASNYYECACDAFWPEAYIPHAAAELRRLHEALESIAACCDEDHAARDYCSRQTEIRGIARAAIAAAEGETK